MNSERQEKQLDIHIRIWENDQVKTSYLTSEFFGHATAEDLQKCLDPVISEFGHRKLMQLSMDGPSVNWKLFRSVDFFVVVLFVCVY